MINLLPPEKKSAIQYARHNTRMLHWSFALVVAMAGVLVIVIAGQFYLSSVSRNLSAQVEQGRVELQAQKLEQTQARVQDISGSLKLSLQVLSRQVLFSKLLQQIGAAMPSGAALTDLSISKVQGGIDLEVGALDYQTATQVQLNLQDPANKIFSKADIVNITCGNEDPDAIYPCAITLRAQFADNNSFTFIPKASGGTSE
jgi:Tfp pilus assembly protein PilN